MESPFLQAAIFLLIGYVFYLWLSDLRSAHDGNPKPGSLPGAVSCSNPILIWGVIGAVGLVGVETAGEVLLKVSSEQTSMTVLFALVTIASGFGEELVFRGYLIVQNRGGKVLWWSAFGFSVLFAIIHPYLWNWEDGTLEIQLSAKALFSTGIVFLNSLWFYFLRFSKANPTRSLWPCILAHAASNGAVFIVKLVGGHIDGLY